MGLAEAQTLLTTARTEMAAGSWQAAIDTLLQAQAAMAEVADGGKGSMTISIRAREIERLILLCRGRLAAASGLSSTKLKRIAVSD